MLALVLAVNDRAGQSPVVTAAERRGALTDGFRILRSLCSLSRHFMIQASVMV